MYNKFSMSPKISQKNRSSRGSGRGNRKIPNPIPPSKFWRQIGTALLIFALIVTLYSAVVENQSKIEKISISDLAGEIIKGDVTKIIVSGDKLTITFKDSTEKISQKETEASLTETLANYKVPSEIGRAHV